MSGLGAQLAKDSVDPLYDDGSGKITRVAAKHLIAAAVSVALSEAAKTARTHYDGYRCGICGGGPEIAALIEAL